MPNGTTIGFANQTETQMFNCATSPDMSVGCFIIIVDINGPKKPKPLGSRYFCISRKPE